MRYLPTGTWMQQADADTIHDIGIPSMVLMEHAAIKTIETMKEEQIDTSRVLVACGSGNNGGDGFAIARLLHQEGKFAAVVFVGNESSLTEESMQQFQIVKNLGIPVYSRISDVNGLFTVVIDAVFGVGLNREVSGKYAAAIEELNAMSGKKIAVDIPSGISSFTGEVLGCAFRADLTVSFQCEKLGTVFFPGAKYAGNVKVVDIGIDTGLFENIKEVAYTLEETDLAKRIPERKADSHKGTFGKVLMLTGSKGMAGAAYLSASAAYAVGAGLVQIYTEESNRVILQQLLPEAIISTYTAYDEEKLDQLLKWADYICIGCGLGQNNISESILKYTLKQVKKPCVVDADGINLLACHEELWKRECEYPLILTPHIKEMSGLLGCSVAEFQSEKLFRLHAFCEEHPAVCVCKDARTVVAQKGKAFFVNTAGNNAMAKAGSGDVLAGVITGLLAGGMEVYDSAVCGVYLHALGGDAAKEMLGSYSVLAKDLIEGIKRCLKKTEELRK